MNFLKNRKAVMGAALSIAFALALCPVVALAAPASSESLFNTFDIENRSEEASAAIDEVGQKHLESVRVGVTTNVANSLALSMDEEADVDYVDQSDLKLIPDSVLRATSCLGVPYVSGSSSPSGFDCSGLVSYALTGTYGHKYRSYDFWAMPEVGDPKPGDVVACSPGHCGLYIGDGKMIHAPETGAVVRAEGIRGKIVRPA